ncbi:PH domain-containing protein [Porphyromonas levii]|uniref:YdbS-like PH domain-containing protein n=1 Tax=Porphyromonas levii TaxID=28114 RepID=A0A4Y8WS07_9PORP|nr:PH domain-containing protein [Porphyromonas levii]TFH96138.1 hypothetical protein E4P48_05650 [Porphyromonas levii]TFH97260.1 hypothetical protein E4P47_00805 [Porphyromonas levii]
MRDFREPTRMGWEALLVLVVKSIWGYIKIMWALLFVVFINGKGKFQLVSVVALIAIAILFVGLAMVRYFTTRLWIRDGKLVCNSGLLNKKEESFPLNRIHAMRTRRNFIYQIVDMVGVVFDTVAEKKAELEFILSEEDWTNLSHLVVEEGESEVPKESRGIDEPLWSYRMNPLELLRAALVQNHLRGMVLIGSVLAYLYAQMPNSEKVIRLATDYLEANSQSIIEHTSLLVIPILLVVGYVIGLLIWWVFVWVKYWGLTLDFYPNYMVYKAGLVNKVTIQLYRDKVIALVTKANPLEKYLGLSSFTLEQAKNIEGDKGENIITIPGVSCIQELEEWLYGTEEQEILFRAHAQKVLFWYSFLPWWLASMPLLGAVIYWDIVAGALISLVVTGVLVWMGMLKQKRSSIQLVEDYIELKSGVIADKKAYIRYEDIEHVRTKLLSLLGYLSKNRHIRLFTKGNPKSIRSVKAPSSATIVDYILYRSSNTTLRNHLNYRR